MWLFCKIMIKILNLACAHVIVPFCHQDNLLFLSMRFPLIHQWIYNIWHPANIKITCSSALLAQANSKWSKLLNDILKQTKRYLVKEAAGMTEQWLTMNWLVHLTLKRLGCFLLLPIIYILCGFIKNMILLWRSKISFSMHKSALWSKTYFLIIQLYKFEVYFQFVRMLIFCCQ